MQQALLVAVYMVMLKIVLGYGHENNAVVIHAFQGAMLALGFAAFVQSLSNRFLGTGLLTLSVISAIYLQTSVTAILAGGFGLVLGMTIFAGIAEMCISRILPQMRFFFKTPLVGLIVTIVGFHLGVIGFTHAVGKYSTVKQYNNLYLLYAGIVFCIILALLVWGKGLLRFYESQDASSSSQLDLGDLHISF